MTTPSNPTPPAATPAASSVTAAQIEAAILDALNETAGIAGTVDPALLPEIVLGRAAATALPGLIADVQALMAQSQPSAADVTALGAKITALSTPQTL